MSSFGIGLGGFVEGYAKSRRLRLDEEEQDRRDKRLELQDARQVKLDARTDLENQRADVEYDRAVGQRNQLDAITSDTKNKFDTAVKAGTAQPDEFDTFWNTEALPRLKQTYLLRGDTENAKKVQEWGDSEGVKAGAKLFATALTKSMAGDWEGSIADANKALQQPGYFGDGYSLNFVDKLVDPSGKELGYRVRLDRPNGEPVMQDVKFSEFPSLIATLGNPPEAYKHQQAALSEAAKRDQELETYTKKKEIDKSYGLGSANKGRSSAITSLRKRMDGGLDGSGPNFDALPADEKEKLIAAELELQTGAAEQPGLAAPAQRKVIVDQTTGERVDPAAARKPTPQKAVEATPEQPPAESNSILGNMARRAKAEFNYMTGQGQAPALFMTGGDNSPGRQIAEQGQQAEPQSKSQIMIANAMKWAAAGENPQVIAKQLIDNGIPPEQWPPELRQTLQQNRAIGLGAR